MTDALRRQVQALDHSILYVVVQPERDMVRPLFAAWRTAATVVTFAALLTLVLALVGIYGIVAHLAEDRTREIGIRVALGARTTEIRLLVLREGARLVLFGTAIGVLLGLAAARLLRSRFYGVSPTEPLAYLVAALALATTALLASYLPARRAARVDPMEALRYE
jgi:putative ABC transport system permease protein